MATTDLQHARAEARRERFRLVLDALGIPPEMRATPHRHPPRATARRQASFRRSCPPSLLAAFEDLGLPLEPETRADRLRRQATDLMERAHAMIACIPGGQPIGSVRQRNRRDRSLDLVWKAVDLDRQAQALDGRAY